VSHTIGSALDIAEQPGRPMIETMKRQLRDRRLLLILDNCEHLIDTCATTAEALLRECPGLRILATSREPLRIPGELTWRVPSLALPDVHHLWSGGAPQEEAMRLFCERAAATVPGFVLTEENAQAVAQICCRLDGIPLAIELAAARASVLSPEQIAERLDDRFALLTMGNRTALNRRQTLRATLDWSYDLLSEGERVLFR